jgi:hypothetical protein
MGMAMMQIGPMGMCMHHGLMLMPVGMLCRPVYPRVVMRMMAVIVPMSMRMGEQCMCMLMRMTFQPEQDDGSDKQHASDEVLHLYAFSKHHGRQE